MTGLIDTHCHLYEPLYDDMLDTLAVEMRENGLEAAICVGCDVKTTMRAIEVAEKYDFIYAQAGFHPCDTADVPDGDWDRMKELAAHPKVVAIGEIGLDYHWNDSPRQTQREWFIRQIRFANEIGLPICIHTRDATAETLDIVRREKPESAVFHCYSGSKETLKEIVKMGYSISLGGVVTFKNARVAVECAAAVPRDRLMLETDCPYLTPEPYRGKLNRPDYTRFVAAKIAEIRGEDPQEVADYTRENAKRFFGI